MWVKEYLIHFHAVLRSEVRGVTRIWLVKERQEKRGEERREGEYKPFDPLCLLFE